ncbi:MAG: hypothetical protein HY902_02940 [Deltaproteobacteria bacterium]|nr:hypothetical protein [Deltaproteobacteria bacterium]
MPWRPSEAYAQHPLVAAARQGPGLPVAVSEALFSERLSADRALAAVDALAAEGLKTHEVDKVLLAVIAKQAGASRGPVDLPEQLAVAALAPKQALLLGWLRARLDAARPEALLRRGDQAGDAGALQLLEQAAAQEPGWQVAHVALQIARWVALPQQRNCAQLQKIVAAAREPGQLPLALPAAQAAIDLALRLDKATPLCPPEVRQDWARPLQLPPPAPEDYRPPGVRPPPPTTPRGHPELDALLLAAPVFRGWIAQPLVKSMVLRTPLLPAPLAASLDADATGDTALAAVNASLYNDRTPISDHVVVAWEALLLRRGLADADRERQDQIAVRDLVPVEAAVLGYARALAGPISGPTDPGQPARLAPAEALFDRARGGLPAQAQLGPLWALALPIEPLRARDACAAARRAEALRVVVQKSALPAEAQQALVSALQIVERACPPPP